MCSNSRPFSTDGVCCSRERPLSIYLHFSSLNHLFIGLEMQYHLWWCSKAKHWLHKVGSFLDCVNILVPYFACATVFTWVLSSLFLSFASFFLCTNDIFFWGSWINLFLCVFLWMLFLPLLGMFAASLRPRWHVGSKCVVTAVKTIPVKRSEVRRLVFTVVWRDLVRCLLKSCLLIMAAVWWTKPSALSLSKCSVYWTTA